MNSVLYGQLACVPKLEPQKQAEDQMSIEVFSNSRSGRTFPNADVGLSVEVILIC